MHDIVYCYLSIVQQCSGHTRPHLLCSALAVLFLAAVMNIRPPAEGSGGELKVAHPIGCSSGVVLNYLRTTSHSQQMHLLSSAPALAASTWACIHVANWLPPVYIDLIHERHLRCKTS